MLSIDTKITLNNIKATRKRFKILADEIKAGNKRITRTIADGMVNDMENRYKAFWMSLDGNPLVKNDVQTHDGEFHRVENSNGGYSIIATGNQIVYDEFGTGMAGAMMPHPAKSKYSGLNDYMSGKRIRQSKNGHWYWVYNGEPTYGQPAGRFMYDTFTEWGDWKASAIARAELMDIVKKSKKG